MVHSCEFWILAYTTGFQRIWFIIHKKFNKWQSLPLGIVSTLISDHNKNGLWVKLDGKKESSIWTNTATKNSDIAFNHCN